MKKMRVIYQDEYLVAVDKPAGILVHPPEIRLKNAQSPIQADVIRVLRKQLQKKVYPVHRLDRATSGVLLLAFDSETARKLQLQFQKQQVQKTYIALVRGWSEETGVISSPLYKRLDGGALLEAETHFETLFRFELLTPSQNFQTSRFSLLKIKPKTGRLHQIRRHLKRVSHPLIGDTVHGDGKQNRIWRDLTGDQRLYLKAQTLQITHPIFLTELLFQSKWSPVWKRMFDRMGYCPLAVL